MADADYHGAYTAERQEFQDRLVLDLIPQVGGPRKAPILLVAAGAVGVGKTHLVGWLQEQGLLPLEEFAVIDPDEIAARLPEHQGYVERDPVSAYRMTRFESGLVAELGLLWALQQRRNIIVHSSLRHGSWHAEVLRRLRKQVPDVRVVLMYIEAPEDVIQKRAEQVGRHESVSWELEVRDSVQSMPWAVSQLLRQAHFFAQVANGGREPKVAFLRGSARDFASRDGPGSPEGGGASGWPEVGRVLGFARGGEPALPLREPPRILPEKGSTEPVLQLLRTIVFAAEKHREQPRKDPFRTPYVSHPLAVARILAESGVRDLATLQTAVLHDTIEDTDATVVELEEAFGAEIAELVASLSDDNKIPPLARKYLQLRGAKRLKRRAKLVRIADKMHNAIDIAVHGVPGWSEKLEARYIAWAWEMVTALQGTHPGLEELFFEEVPMPEGYEFGDWEKFAAEEVGDDVVSRGSQLSECLAEDSEDREGPSELRLGSTAELVRSILSAAEFSARHCRIQEQPCFPSASSSLRAFSVAQVLVQHHVRDEHTLQAALISGAVPPTLDAAAAKQRLVEVRDRFGDRVASLVWALFCLGPENLSESRDIRRLPHQAKVIRLAQDLLALKSWHSGDAGLGAARAALDSHFFVGTHRGLEDAIGEALCRLPLPESEGPWERPSAHSRARR